MKRFSRSGDIRVGVVGYGGAFNMGRQHLELMRDAGMTPVAVAEIDPKRCKAAEADFPGIDTFDSLGIMLRGSDVNLVTIITPHNTHAKLALQALRAGCSVCCEKPLAITTAECDRMIKAARDHRAMLSTYHNRHWDGCILRAVEQIKTRKAIGDIVRIEAHMGGYGRPRNWWRSSRSISGGILYDWGVHLLEYGLQLIDGDIAEVSGYAKEGFWGPKTSWKDDANEDEGHAVIRFSTGQWMTLTITQIDSKSKAQDRGQLEITGTKGTYVFSHNTWELTVHKGDKKTVTSGANPPNQYEQYYRNVADHMVKGRKLVIDGEWARRPIHILDLAARSARQGKAIKAKYK